MRSRSAPSNSASTCERRWRDYARWSRRRHARCIALASAGDRVAIMGESCEEWMILRLAAQSLGAIVYGIYPTASAAKIAYQMRDGGARSSSPKTRTYVDKVLGPIADQCGGQRGHRGDRRFGDVRLCASQDPYRLHESGRRRRQARLAWLAKRQRVTLSPDDPAFIVYTSGTTGHPKGALVSHGRHLAAADDSIGALSHIAYKREHRTVVFCQCAMCSAAMSR